MKANESEPLMKGRNQIRRCRNPSNGVCVGTSVGLDLKATDAASGLEAARAWIGLGHGTFEPVVVMPREKLKRRPRESQSTDARHRGGTTRSSVEGPVTGLEPRGRVVRLRPKANASAEEPMGEDQPLWREP